MEFNEFQRRARETDRTPQSGPDATMVPLLGLTAAVGDLASDVKKQARDRSAYTSYKASVELQLGSILWFIANLTDKFGLDLDAVAANNLTLSQSRWGPGGSATPDICTLPAFFDDDFDDSQQLPRTFRIEFRETAGRRDRVKRVQLRRNGQNIGEALTDSHPRRNGYRYHDCFHLAYASVLGWSPVTRRLLGCKRKSDSTVDSEQDGGRAIVIEESIAVIVFEYAERHNYLEGITTLDYRLLRTIRNLCRDLEVEVRSEAEWERAIIRGFAVWRSLRDHGGGIVSGNLTNRSFTFRKSTH